MGLSRSELLGRHGGTFRVWNPSAVEWLRFSAPSIRAGMEAKVGLNYNSCHSLSMRIMVHAIGEKDTEGRACRWGAIFAEHVFAKRVLNKNASSIKTRAQNRAQKFPENGAGRRTGGRCSWLRRERI
jgi:hypothetical protein